MRRKVLLSILFSFFVFVTSFYYTFLYFFNFLVLAQDDCNRCDCSGYPRCEGNTWVSCSCVEDGCCRVENGSCVANYIVPDFDRENCGNSGYVCEEDGENIAYYSCGCSDGCYSIKVSTSNCGTETDSDGGDNPRVAGTVTDYFCSGGSTPCHSSGSCQSARYSDYCSGICSRSELTEYYLNGEKVASKIYSNLFSQGQYCKNGAVYDDKQKPTASLSLQSQNWVNRDISVNIMCDDHDESGCHKYYYSFSRVV